MQICAGDAASTEQSTATVHELLQFNCLNNGTAGSQQNEEAGVARVFFFLVVTFFLLTWVVLWLTLGQYALSRTCASGRTPHPHTPHRRRGACGSLVDSAV